MIQILIEKLLILYSKGKSRVFGLQQDKQDLIKLLFVIHVIPLLPEFDLLLNIDESSFSRSMELTHSVMKSGKSYELYNICFSNSTSLITTITSNGKIFAGNTTGAVNSTMFIFLEEALLRKINRCLVIFGNAKLTDEWKLLSIEKNLHLRLFHLTHWACTCWKVFFKAQTDDSKNNWRENKLAMRNFRCSIWRMN